MALAARIGRYLMQLESGKMPDTSDLDRHLSRLVDAAASNAPTNSRLIETVHNSWDTGKDIDVSNAVYGPSHFGRKDFVDVSFPYYHFLAGFVRSQNCKSIFEIGTHYGGSALAMIKGMPSARIVTVDISDLNKDLHQTTGIVKLTGDANEAYISKTAVTLFAGKSIDLLYLDAAHRFSPTLINFGLYSLLLKPRFILVDDILLNQEMRSFWDTICILFGPKAVNCADIVPSVRDSNVGFGLIQCD